MARETARDVCALVEANGEDPRRVEYKRSKPGSTESELISKIECCGAQKTEDGRSNANMTPT